MSACTSLEDREPVLFHQCEGVEIAEILRLRILKAVIYRVDVGSGTRQALEMPGVWSTDLDRVSYVTTTSSGRDVFRFFSGRGYHLTSLLPGAKGLTPPVEAMRCVGEISESTVIVIDARGEIERVDLETGSRERVFTRRRE